MGKSYRKKSKWTPDKSIKETSHRKNRRMTDGICRQFENGDVNDDDLFFPEDKYFHNKYDDSEMQPYDDFDNSKKFFQRPPDKRRLDEEV